MLEAWRPPPLDDSNSRIVPRPAWFGDTPEGLEVRLYLGSTERDVRVYVCRCGAWERYVAVLAKYGEDAADDQAYHMALEDWALWKVGKNA